MNMKKQQILLVSIIGGIILLAVGGYYLLSQPENLDTASQTNPLSQQTADPIDGKSLRELLGIRDNQTCTFKDEESKSDGKVFISNQRMRGDFTGYYNGQESTSHMIVDTDKVYLWQDNNTDGFSMSRDALEDMQSDPDAQNPVQSNFDVNKKVDYSCASWNADATLFIPPSNVTFNDYTEMVEQSQEMMESSKNEMMENKEAACNQCEQLPAEAQGQCKAALQC